MARKQQPTRVGGHDSYLGVRNVSAATGRRGFLLKWVSCDGVLTRTAGVRQPFPEEGRAVAFGLRHFGRRAVRIPPRGRAPKNVCDVNVPLGRARRRK